MVDDADVFFSSTGMSGRHGTGRSVVTSHGRARGNKV